MMKKLAVLIMVLGMASLANAAVLELSVDGNTSLTEYWMAPSDTFVLDVFASSGYIGGDFIITLSNDQGAMSYDDQTDGPIWYATTYINPIDIGGGEYFDQVVDFDFAFGITGGEATPDIPTTSTQIGIGGGNFGTPIPFAEGHYEGQVVVDGIVFHCEEATDVTITITAAGDPQAGEGITTDLDFDGTNETILGGTVIDTILIHQTPEPATMALLGLGGLLLRKRK